MSTSRLHNAIYDYSREISACARDKRRAVLNCLVRELVNGIAGLAEDLTDENPKAVSDCAEYLTAEIAEMFLDAEDKAEDRRNNPSETERDFAAA